MIIEGLARFAVELDYPKLPAAVLRSSKRLVLDWIGVALSGARDPSTEMLYRVVSRSLVGSDASFVGRADKGSVLGAALVNGHMSHVMHYDETHSDLFFHPSSPILPAILALGESRHINGRSLIVAHAVGVETSVRILRSMYPMHYNMGWHTTGTIGTFGAAVAAGRVLGLTTQQMANAIGIAATQAAGLHELKGSMCIALNVGKAASNGVLAALLAAEGFTSTPEMLDKPRGLWAVYAAVSAPPTLEGLGSEWEILRIGVKRHASGFIIQPLIDAAVELHPQVRDLIHEVVSVEVVANPHVLEIVSDDIDPTSSARGIVSAHHCVAVGLIDGMAQPQQFTDERVRASDVAALRSRVVLSPDPAMGLQEARVVVSLKNRAAAMSHVREALGTADNPLSDEQLHAKYDALAAPILGVEQSRRLAAAIDGLESVGDLASVAACFRVSDKGR